MTSEPQPAADKAVQKWEYLFKEDNTPTDLLHRLLLGIAYCISKEFYDTDHDDLTPNQLSAFYRTCGGDYDRLFTHMPSQSIAFIYQSLGCLHSLQPNSSDGDYAPPTVPALKPQGFVTWQTIQLLLGPEEHVPFMQNALREFDVVDPVDKKPFPKDLPAEAFPQQPDPGMVKWHEGVSSRLRIEAIQAEKSTAAMGERSPHLESAAQERSHAAQYFSNPFYRTRDGRPSIVRHNSNEGKPGFVRQLSKAPARVLQGGKVVGSTLLDIANPNLFGGSAGNTRRRALTERSYSSERIDREHQQQQQHHNERPPTGNSSSAASTPRHPHPRFSRRSPSPPSRSSSSASDDRTRLTSQQMRRRRSHDPPSSPREYFSHHVASQNHSASRSTSSHRRRVADHGRSSLAWEHDRDRDRDRDRGVASPPAGRRPSQASANAGPSYPHPQAARSPLSRPQPVPVPQPREREHYQHHPQVHFSPPTSSPYSSSPTTTTTTTTTAAAAGGAGPQQPNGSAGGASSSAPTTLAEQEREKEKERVRRSSSHRRRAAAASTTAGGAKAGGVGVDGVGGRRYPDESPWR